MEEKEGEKENIITMATKIDYTHLARIVRHISGQYGIHNFITVNIKHVTPDPFTLVKPLPVVSEGRPNDSPSIFNDHVTWIYLL